MNMKFLTLVAVASISLTACNDAASKIKSNSTSSVEYGSTEANNPGTINATQVSANGSGEFTFDKTSHDFGDINQGETVETMFEFTNTGDAPLIISNAVGSCGCTVPEYPRTPIAPGASAKMKVSFNSAGKRGQNNKNVTITANTVPETTVLQIRANVLVDEQNG